jgi:protein required for attachment to host cells
MLLPHGTLIAVIDARNFHLFHNAGDEAAPELTEVETPKLDAHNHSAGSHHGSVVTMTNDAHEIAAVAWLGAEAQAHRLEHLVIIAPPRALGELRKHYTKPLEKALLGELAKDLQNPKAADVLNHLRAK